jgi:hypothetical protein
MDSKGKMSQAFGNNNLQGSQLRGLRKNRWWNCVQTDINKLKLITGKRGQRTDLTGRCTLRRQRSSLDMEE